MMSPGGGRPAGGYFLASCKPVVNPLQLVWSACASGCRRGDRCDGRWNQPIEDGVGISRIADEGVPFVDRDLAGEDGRATSVAFLEDFVKVRTGTGVERVEA